MPPKKASKAKPLPASLILGALILGTAGLSALAYLVFGRGSDTPDTPATTTPTTLVSAPLDAFRAQPVACGGTLPAASSQEELTGFSDQGITDIVNAVIKTSCGEITIELDPSTAPESVNNFVFLSRRGFYDGIVFHRIVPGFMAQTGDPLAAGYGGPGYSLPDEPPASDFVYEKGVVAMAKGNEISGSQFFIVTGDASHLEPVYNVLGRVIDGWDVLDQIDSIPITVNPMTGENSFPTQSAFIEGITIVEPGTDS